MADLLATPEDLASYLQKDLDTATATLALETATALVQTATGQRIVQVVDDEVILDLDEYDGGNWIFLPEGPVTEVSAVLVGETPATDYSAQLGRGRLYRANGWRSLLLPTYVTPSTVTVTYTHGLPAGDQRLQMAKMAALTLAALAYENPNGAVREQIDDYSVQYEAASSLMSISPAMAAALRRRYGLRRRSVRLITAS